MKTKLYAVLLCAAFMLCFAASSNAQTITVFAGSSGAINSFAVASQVSSVCNLGPNFWSQGSTTGNGMQDANSSPLEKGTTWVSYDGPNNGSAPTAICAYVSVDSVVGNRLYFSSGTGTASGRSQITLGGSLVGGNKIALVPDNAPGGDTLPANIQTLLNNAPITAAVSDIRPEDALWTTTRVRNGLSWGNNPICSAFTATSAQTINYTIEGTDPLGGKAVPAYTTINVGAYPVMVFYNKTGTGTTDLGTLLPSDVSSHNLAAIWGGLGAQTTDLGHFAAGTYNIGGGPIAVGGSGEPLTVLIREPISGTYNTFEWQGVRNQGTQQTQEAVFTAVGNPVSNPCTGPFPPTSPSTNPSYVVTGGNHDSAATYARAIGTSEMVTQAKGIKNAVGYAFWSFSTYAGTTSQLNYLTVDGVDPLVAGGTGGSFPQCTTTSPITCPALSLTNVLNGSYRLWNIIRVISPTTGTPASNVASFVVTAQNQASPTALHEITDFVPFVANGKQNLSVFRSHYAAPNLGVSQVCTSTSNINSQVDGPVQAGLVGCPEGGGDMAGAIFTWGQDIDTYLTTGQEILSFIQ
jgi:hypothetical protein